MISRGQALGLSLALIFAVASCTAFPAFLKHRHDLRITEVVPYEPPDISYCFRPGHGVIWDCIRDAEYFQEMNRSDI